MFAKRQQRAQKNYEDRWGHISTCVELMGAGSFGDVFRLSTERQMVVKICEIDDDYSNKVVRREIEIMRAIDHPNVLGLLKSERFKGYAFIFMDLCVPLTAFLRRRITEDQLLEIVFGMVSGVAYLHAQHIMHRDLKPPNLLVNHGQLVIADFGHSIQLQDDEEWDLGRRDGEAYTKEVVTRWWRPPEVILLLPYTWRIDIWSMGCIVYELVLNYLGVPNAILLPAPHTRDADDPEDDLLHRILELLGSPTAEEKKELADCPLREYALNTLKDSVPPKPMPEGMPSQYWEIIVSAMRWLPRDRASAANILSMFDRSSKRLRTD